MTRAAEGPSAALLPPSASTAHELVPQDPEVPGEAEHLVPWLESASILAHLALFAILGVAIRVSLEVLFGPAVAGVTSDQQPLFLDVPANMHIAQFLQPLAVGLSTGLCGSITTFASWNQRMLAILAYGHVVHALAGYLLGAAVAYYSFVVGVHTAEAVEDAVAWINQRRVQAGKPPLVVKPEHYMRRWVSLVLVLALCVVAWSAAGVVAALEGVYELRKAGLACVVGPFGCWVRWWLSQLNGRGVGPKQRWKWVPLGTLAANLGAVALEAALSAVDAVYNTQAVSLVLRGFMSGFLGCMSTVSTLIQEVYILQKQREGTRRSYIYLYGLTISIALILGVGFYCVPVWLYGVACNGYNLCAVLVKPTVGFPVDDIEP